MRGPLFHIGAKITCKQVNRALASGEKLKAGRRIQVWSHLKICEACRNFSQHLASISSGVRSLCARRVDIDTLEGSLEGPKRMRELEDEILKRLQERES